MKRTTGFTLIELILVMVVISVGFVGLARLFANTNAGLFTAERTQLAAQLAQECAEHVLGKRRDVNFASGLAATCAAGSSPLLPAPPAGYVRSLNFVDFTAAACPSGATCKLATVNVSNNGLDLSTVNFMLVNY